MLPVADATLLRPWLNGLRDWLRASPAVVAIVGQRTYLGALPLGSVFPALVVSRVGGGMDGYTYDAAMIQVEAWAPGGSQAETLITTAVTALASAPEGTVLSASAQLMGARLNALLWYPDPDTDTPRYIATMDVDVRAVA